MDSEPSDAPLSAPDPDEAVNDQSGEAGPGVVGRVTGADSGDGSVPASPTPEPPETPDTASAAPES